MSIAGLNLQPHESPADEEDGGGLAATHRGSVYQDVATAYFPAKTVVTGADRVIVDRKRKIVK